MKNVTVKIHTKSIIAKLLTLAPGLSIVTIGRHIFLEGASMTAIAKNHEMIHVAQYQRHGILGFLWRYCVKEMFVPYREKTFEKEAYENEADFDYLSRAYPDMTFDTEYC
jgi:hypothetical protein